MMKSLDDLADEIGPEIVGRFLCLVAASVPEGKIVGEVLTQDDLKRLLREARVWCEQREQ
jgi:hypothetical protein